MARGWVVALAAAGALTLGLGTAAQPASADSVRAGEWWLAPMHATQMWQQTRGVGITVAVVDSGVQADHPDLIGQVLPGKNFSNLPGGAQTDTDGHGTRMASLISGTGNSDNGQGAIGLAPGVKILPLRIWKSGSNEADASAMYSVQLATAVRYAADSEAQIINLSQGQEEDVASVREAIAYAESKGKLVVAAVGNSGNTGNPVNYPAAYPGVLGVAAVNESIKPTAESEYGSQVALAAPGDNMADACPSSTGYCTSHGTSDSTALVSASAALVWSLHRDWTADQVIRVLINTADGQGKWDPHFGWGVVRPRIALTDAGDPGPADVNPLLAASASGSASPVASQSAHDSTASPAPVAATQNAKDSGNGLLYAGLGGVALLAVITGIVLALRRRTSGGI
ncbi:type VII secretion-associated serine protease mycosin [Streptacidiphilus jiangxiensis]|uniref:Type VII secretion-associated serine protease mycosin n=2 Tax=Streptacidiphilus jiangxiensis TaxID=235985 RepID=A0A1H7RE75_STRJI|nr:type VII secretion-associated serine protease mycosin [Streptacidiphilus jiangxiensis]SEL58620.1 type VII secretion-associated serine protease mycosin [Streptacidiphilus jiangxiensis]